jgi:hypothetical protein
MDPRRVSSLTSDRPTVREVTLVRDEDIGKRLYRPIELYDRNGNPVDFSETKVRTIIETVDRCPTSWTSRLIYEEIRESGRHDVSEELVHSVMNAMRKSDLPR